MLYPSSHICVQCRLFGRGIIISTVLRAKHGRSSLKRFTTWRATPDDSCTSAQSVTVYARLILCINTFCNGLSGAEQPKPLLCQGLSCTTTSFPHRWLQSSQQPSMAYSNSSYSQMRLLRSLQCSYQLEIRLGGSWSQTVAALLQWHCSYPCHSTTTVSHHSRCVCFS